MHIQRLRTVRDAIAAPPPGVHFDMNQIMTETTACIAGFAHILFTPDATTRNWDEDQILKLLGLTHQQGIDLFFPDIGDRSYRDITAAQAIATLDHLIETGEIKWTI